MNALVIIMSIAFLNKNHHLNDRNNTRKDTKRNSTNYITINAFLLGHMIHQDDNEHPLVAPTGATLYKLVNFLKMT